MARTTTTKYTCDECKKPCTDLYGPLLITIRNQDMEVIKHADVCSWVCAHGWMTTLAENPQS